MNPIVSISLLFSLVACGSNIDEPTIERPPNLPSTGSQYIVSSIRLGGSPAESVMNGFDLDGDDVVDNYLGQSIAVAYTALDRDSQGDLDAAVLSGEMMHLLMIGDVDAEYLDSARLFLGSDTDDDSTNNFTGDAELAVRPGTPLNGALFGENLGDELVYADGRVTVENTLFGAVRMPLVAARLEAVVLSDGTIDGRIGGAIREQELESELRPSLVSSILADVESDCQPSAGPGCCDSGSRGADWVSLFDTNEDCQLTSAEVEDNGIFGALLAPDIDLDEDDINDALSVGFGFTAVPARFDIPR